tara:strand:+ start:231 stop:1313 length:1083 start_codon:yes stop_codon:yes gene_type:complete
MAQSFKTLLPEDKAATRTLLHEAIPITGTIASGTYGDNNIKYFAHGMYEAVYDYPYLSSSANHIFDITAGYASGSRWAHTASNIQDSKKVNIYNQMAQVLAGYDINSDIKQFDQDASAATTKKMDSCVFINFARLLTKDEIKKDSFRFTFFGNNVKTDAFDPDERDGEVIIGDYGAQTTYKIDSPAGEYGLLYTSSATPWAESPVGHIYYQAGIVVLTSSVMLGGTPTTTTAGVVAFPYPDTESTGSRAELFKSGSISEIGNAIRYATDNISFNNTTELNSTIYFCRANNTEYNFSANSTYLSASEIRVKGNNPLADPVTYITTVGLYSPDNELLAVAKLSEPLKKTPSNELTLRVRLDY